MASSIHFYLKENQKHLLIKFDHILAVIEFKTENFVKDCKAVSSVYPQHKQDSEKNQTKLKVFSIYLQWYFLYRTFMEVQLSSMTWKPQK